MPEPTSRVVKNGSKMRSLMSGEHPGPAVAHFEEHVVPGGDATRLEAGGRFGMEGGEADLQDPARAARGLPRVRGEVHQHLVHLGGVAQDEGAGRHLRPHLDVRGEGGAHQTHHLGHQPRHVQGLPAGLTLAAELQDLLHEVAAPPCDLERLLEVAGGGGVGGHPRACELDAADDGVQDVVEVVGDPSGQGAQGLQLLGLAQLGLQATALLLGAEALGDVARIDEDAFVRAPFEMPAADDLQGAPLAAPGANGHVGGFRARAPAGAPFGGAHGGREGPPRG